MFQQQDFLILNLKKTDFKPIALAVPKWIGYALALTNKILSNSEFGQQSIVLNQNFFFCSHFYTFSMIFPIYVAKLQ